ncbi:MAG TPA: GntR family transcriptional regulator [Chloroflexota bacterium]|nr:GntR family transcriptional regulator [Chloroflexota bacterium]
MSAAHVSNPAPLDRASDVPLHQQLSRALAGQIAEGRYRPGAAIPPERQLCSLYGVSITTVRQAVLDLAEKGMVERAVGRGTFVLAARPRGLRIGLLSTHDLSISQESMTPIVAAMQEATGVEGSSLLHIHQEAPGPMAAFLGDVLRRREADALILFTHQPLDVEDVEELAMSGVPYVVFNRYLEGRAINCVVIDDREATERAVDYLWKLGHRRIVHVAGQQHITVGRDRAAGYRAAMRRRGLEPWVIDAGWPVEAGYTAAEILLRAPERPTAVVASADGAAIGVIHAARRAGLEVPHDLSVMGFGHLPGSDLVDPPLTTMGYDRPAIGRETIAALLRMVERGEGVGKVVVPAVFVERASCGPAPTVA